jgi:hypothetical protein
VLSTAASAQEPMMGDPAVAAQAEAPKEEKSWTDDISIGAFVDAYYSVNFNFPKVAGAGNPAANQFRVFDPSDGFSLSWAGLDVSYDGGPVGATIALRFGPTARLYNFDWSNTFGDGTLDGIQGTIEYVKEAFVTWKPLSMLTIDFGRFGTIYGAEVAESWQNINYTRGMLNGFAQPFHHTGLRVGVELSPAMALTLLAVNGWDNLVDNNRMKSFGAQFSWSSDMASVILGYLFGPEQTGNNDNFRHFVDLVATASFGPAQIIFNGDFIAEDDGNNTAIFFGLSLAAQYKLSDLFAVGGRVEYLNDQDDSRFGVGTPIERMITGTLTFDIIPADFMSLRLDVRGDFADQSIFTHEDTPGDRKYQITSTLGAVVYTN